jgi:hypothetical protein
MTMDRGQMTDARGILNAEVGMRKAETWRQVAEFGSRIDSFQPLMAHDKNMLQFPSLCLRVLVAEILQGLNLL